MPGRELVLVTVVQVRVVRMTVCQRLMPVPMAVRMVRDVIRSTGVLVMRVVMVQMLVLDRCVRVNVFVPLR